MGEIRNGARSALNLLKKACKLSRMTGFRQAIINILGSETATDFFSVWDPFCDVMDAIISGDNYFNQIDYVAEHTGDEDASPPI